jgi:hypothetical protein
LSYAAGVEGTLPNVHPHLMMPAARIYPADEPQASGIGDIELK